MMFPITPEMILAERNMKRQLGVLAHTLNVEGGGMFWLGCDCYNCRDHYDPTGEQDAAKRNALAQPPNGGAGARGFLARADGVRPEDAPQRAFLPRADAIRPDDPIVQMCRDAHLPLPPPPPVLERQNAVILGRAAEPLRPIPVDDARILEQMLARWRDQAEQARQNLDRLGQPANNDHPAQIAHLEARLGLLKAEQKVEKLSNLLQTLRPQT